MCYNLNNKFRKEAIKMKKWCPECEEYTEQRYYPSSRYEDSYYQCKKCGFCFTIEYLKELKQKEVQDEL